LLLFWKRRELVTSSNEPRRASAFASFLEKKRVA
jgi:hypothetical protein